MLQSPSTLLDIGVIGMELRHTSTFLHVLNFVILLV